MEDVIIIGTGCAGYTAAIYTARANLKPLMLSGTQPGGQLTTTTEVENFPGHPDGIMGPDLMMRMQTQAEKFGSRIAYEMVESVTRRDDGTFAVKTGSATHEAKTVIVATGAAPRHLGLPNEKSLIGRGLTSCATCDGAFYPDVPVAVIGGGDSACEEAGFLTRFASKVYLVHRRDELRASKIMADRALNNPKIEMLWNTEVVDILGENKVQALALKNTVTGELSQRDFTGLFVAIGHIPRSELLIGQIDCDNEGYVKVEGRSTRTNLPGVFACGDLVDHTYRQAITAAGSGCQAALDAEKFLSH